MILGLVLGYLFFGGSSSMLALQGHSPADFEKAIKHVVLYDDRKKAALAEIELWDKSLKTQDKAASKDEKTLVKSLRRHDTTRADVDQLDANLDATFGDMDSNFLDTRFRVKEFITKEEWAELAARLSKH
jgi:hypothetical protein